MKEISVIPLRWETDKFGINCAKYIISENDEEDNVKQTLAELSEYDFVTVVNESNRTEINEIIGCNTAAYLADVNIQFKKEVRKKEKDGVIEYGIAYNSSMLKIAAEAYDKSRFIGDRRLARYGARDVYVDWLSNSFGRQDKGFVTKNGEKGFLLFSEDDNSFTVELIAVDSHSRNSGLGTSMLNTLESFAFQKGKYFIRVGTQLNNIAAINFYHKNGFKEIGRSSVYHLWNGDKKT